MDVPIEKISYLDRKALTSILNRNQSWKKLAVAMEFLDCEMDRISSSTSPGDMLLDLFGGKYGNPIGKLFIVLWKNEMHSAMNAIRSYMPEKYHKLIRVDAEPIAETSKKEDNQEEALLTRDSNNTKKQLSVSGVVESAGSIPPIGYAELEDCTASWSADCVLGRGGYATVFRGRWKHTDVAIKRIEAKRDNSGAHEEQLRQSMAELQFLNAYRHENILPIYAYSIGGQYPCLVYQFMPGGSLDRRIHTQDRHKFLTWTKRLDIAIGAARGLQYLHTLRQKPLIHVDIKPANILLDANDVPKIGDFGLARLGPDPSQQDVEVSRTFGTLPYLPMDFLTSKRLRPQLDVYSFGVVLFEMATGLPVMTDSRPHRLLRDHVLKHLENLKSILKLKDVRMPGGEKIFVFLIVYGQQCVSANPAERPSMVTVLEELEKIPRE